MELFPNWENILLFPFGRSLWTEMAESSGRTSSSDDKKCPPPGSPTVPALVSQCLDKNKPLEGHAALLQTLIDFCVRSAAFNSSWDSDL